TQDEDPREIARIVLDEQFLFQAPHIRRENRRPVSQAKKVDTVWSQGALLFGQERHPERHSVDGHAQRERRLVVLPYGDRRALQGAMDAVVIASSDLMPDPAFQLAKRQPCGLV